MTRPKQPQRPVLQTGDAAELAGLVRAGIGRVIWRGTTPGEFRDRWLPLDRAELFRRAGRFAGSPLAYGGILRMSASRCSATAKEVRRILAAELLQEQASVLLPCGRCGAEMRPVCARCGKPCAVVTSPPRRYWLAACCSEAYARCPVCEPPRPRRR